MESEWLEQKELRIDKPSKLKGYRYRFKEAIIMHRADCGNCYLYG